MVRSDRLEEHARRVRSRPALVCLLGLGLLVGTAGCANLVTKKVPLEARLSGKDEHHHGFRYYLPRPYIVVSEPVTLSRDFEVGNLVRRLNHSDTLYMEFSEQVDGTADHQLRYDRLDGSPADPSLNPGDFEKVSMAEVEGPARDVILRTSATMLQPTEIFDDVVPRDRSNMTGGFLSLDQLANYFQVVDPIEAPPDAFQVVQLPDFEEQMAIEDRNFAAYSKYDLQFADGWQLRSVNSNVDATETAVRAFQSISNAIGVAASLEAEELNTLPLTPEEIARQGADPRSGLPGENPKVVRVVKRLIPPGLYRLNKTSEIHPHAADAVNFGLLGDLGFPIETEQKYFVVNDSPDSN